MTKEVMRMAKALAALQAKIAGCHACPLAESRTQVVLSEAVGRPRLILIGEAPGGAEDLCGRPFSGKAGALLDDFLQRAGLERHELYISNAVKCRPVKPSARGRYGPWANRKPTRGELLACAPWLDAELALFPGVPLATLGAVPLGRLLQKAQPSMGEQHGRPFFSMRYERWIFPLYHPAALIYDPAKREDYENDLRKLAAALAAGTLSGQEDKA